jgi:hypothetical protein
VLGLGDRGKLTGSRSRPRISPKIRVRNPGDRARRRRTLQVPLLSRLAAVREMRKARRSDAFAGLSRQIEIYALGVLA